MVVRDVGEMVMFAVFALASKEVVDVILVLVELVEVWVYVWWEEVGMLSDIMDVW